MSKYDSVLRGGSDPFTRQGGERRSNQRQASLLQSGEQKMCRVSVRGRRLGSCIVSPPGPIASNQRSRLGSKDGLIFHFASACQLRSATASLTAPGLDGISKDLVHFRSTLTRFDLAQVFVAGSRC